MRVGVPCHSLEAPAYLDCFYSSGESDIVRRYSLHLTGPSSPERPSNRQMWPPDNNGMATGRLGRMLTEREKAGNVRRLQILDNTSGVTNLITKSGRSDGDACRWPGQPFPVRQSSPASCSNPVPPRAAGPHRKGCRGKTIGAARPDAPSVLRPLIEAACMDERNVTGQRW
jgi:hypothetical protein